MGYPRSFAAIDTGLIQTKGLYVSGTDLKLHDYKIRVGSGVYTGSDGIVADFTALTGSEYYAMCMKESDGVISAQVIDDFDNWTRSGNVLNLDDIYDGSRGYCYDTISGTGYRIFFVFQVNAGSTNLQKANGITYGFNVFNRPKTHIVATTISQSINSATFTKINYDTVQIDLTGEYDAATYEFEPTRTRSFIISSQIMWNAANWNIGQRYDMYIYRNNATAVQEQFEQNASLASNIKTNRAIFPTQGNVGDSYDVRVYQNAGTRTLSAATTDNRYQIREF